MNVSSVKFEQKPVGFNANIKFVQNGANNLLSQRSMETLTQKARGIGNKSDIITIYLSQKKTNGFVTLQEDTFKNYTSISGEFGNESPMCLPYFVEIGNVYGDEINREKKAFVLVDHFINMINNALKR